uniref:Uncharacterized protein n=1 Tax=viral metagenome TaxID=1070528 RepID=A0A6C0ASY9_9ZZZZ
MAQVGVIYGTIPRMPIGHSDGPSVVDVHNVNTAPPAAATRFAFALLRCCKKNVGTRPLSLCEAQQGLTAFGDALQSGALSRRAYALAVSRQEYLMLYAGLEHVNTLKDLGYPTPSAGTSAPQSARPAAAAHAENRDETDALKSASSGGHALTVARAQRATPGFTAAQAAALTLVDEDTDLDTDCDSVADESGDDVILAQPPARGSDAAKTQEHLYEAAVPHALKGEAGVAAFAERLLTALHHNAQSEKAEPLCMMNGGYIGWEYVWATYDRCAEEYPTASDSELVDLLLEQDYVCRALRAYNSDIFDIGAHRADPRQTAHFARTEGAHRCSKTAAAVLKRIRCAAANGASTHSQLAYDMRALVRAQPKWPTYGSLLHTY